MNGDRVRELEAAIEAIRQVVGWETGAASEYHAFYEIARIVDAAPGPRVVSTVEELDALPDDRPVALALNHLIHRHHERLTLIERHQHIL